MRCGRSTRWVEVKIAHRRLIGGPSSMIPHSEKSIEIIHQAIMRSENQITIPRESIVADPSETPVRAITRPALYSRAAGCKMWIQRRQPEFGQQGWRQPPDRMTEHKARPDHQFKAGGAQLPLRERAST